MAPLRSLLFKNLNQKNFTGGNRGNGVDQGRRLLANKFHSASLLVSEKNVTVPS